MPRSAAFDKASIKALGSNIRYSLTGGCMSAKSNRERQKRWRERTLKESDGPQLTRLQVYIEPAAAADLEQIVRKTGWTKRVAIETAIKKLVRDVD